MTCYFQITVSINQQGFSLKTVVGRKKAVQDIDVIGEFKKRVVTLLVMSVFSNFPGASRACADFFDPTAVYRFSQTSSTIEASMEITGIAFQGIFENPPYP